jgi:hypothetical protein
MLVRATAATDGGPMALGGFDMANLVCDTIDTD